MRAWSFRGFRWTPVELIALAVGCATFPPLGLAVLGFKHWQYRTGGPDLWTAAAGAWGRLRAAFDGAGAAPPAWAGGFAPSTGNAAFDAWRGGELARLEQERRRLEQAHREFAEWLDTVRRARDREEFERFMSERRR